MDVREKLVDIVCDATQINGCIHSCNHPPCAMVRGIVGALIENGVTVQEWISVDERLPQNFISVLGYMTDAGEFPPVRECYTVGNAFFFPALGDVHPVSHWCEIPQLQSRIKNL